MSRSAPSVFPQNPGRSWADEITLLLRILAKLGFWVLLAFLFMAAICWFFITAVAASVAGGRR